MKTAEIMTLLRRKYAGDEYFMLEEVRDRAGFDVKRTADALVMGLWPSRGLHLEGFEVKASRGDWVNELHNPAKADVFWKLCHKWWVVAGDEKIVKKGELPDGWGLMVPSPGKSGGLVTEVTAALKADTPPPTWDFFASMMKRMSNRVEPYEHEITAARAEGMASGKEAGEYASKLLRQNVNELRTRIQEFEKASGVQIPNWNYGVIGDAVKVVLNGGTSQVRSQLLHLADQATQLAEQARRAAGDHYEPQADDEDLT